MRRTALVLTLVSAAPLGAQAFEGAVSMTVTGDDGRARPINYQTKDGKIRYEVTGGPGGETVGMVIDPAAQKMLIIMAGRKMYMEQVLSPGSGRGRGRAGGRGEAVRTGKTETIAGHTCEHVTVIDDDGISTDVCAATDLGSFHMFLGGGPMAPPHEAGWATQLGPNAFPLRVQKGTKVILDVTSVESKSLDAALFAAPDGFQKFAIPGRPGD